jgi:glycosyltransferase involved in cell wall biosynthesis
MTGASYKIGMLTPYAWTEPGGVNQHIDALATRFTAMGHRVTIIAPSDERAKVKEARARVRSFLLDKRDTLFAGDEPYPRYFFAGGAYKVRYNRSVSVIAVPLSLVSNVDVLLDAEQLDILHIHEPFVPSLGWNALRHADCPMVATFHANSERFLSYWVSKPVLKRSFQAFDEVIAVSRAARSTAAKYFEGEYRIIPNGIDLSRFPPARRRPSGPLRVLFVGTDSRRKGLRILLAAMAHLADTPVPFEVHICGSDKQESRFARYVPRAFEGRVHFHGRVPNDQVVGLYHAADVFCAPSLGNESFGIVLLEAMATGTAIVASDIDGYRDVVTDRREGILVTPGDPEALARGLQKMLCDDILRSGCAAQGIETAQFYSWDRIAGEVADVYDEAFSRLKHPQRIRAKARARAELYADLHVHSHHSSDCTATVPEILERARECGIGIVAITDHNTIEGGLEGRALADQYGVRVIVGEEVKTSEGEVIGLFLERPIAPGMTFAETIAAIHAQNGIVYVPHPFDRMHEVPSYKLLKASVGDLDVVEVFNSRIAFPSFNERAERFAARYRIAAAAGSDAHVLPGIGTALTGMAEFEGPADFVAALDDSRIVRRRKSLIYLQSLKLLQTSLEGQSRE